MSRLRFPKRLLVAALLTITILLSGLVAANTVRVNAADSGTSEAAIALAAQSPAFVSTLADNPGWKAVAYYTGNRFQIWRVTFWTASGADLGWADVSLAHNRVYSWEAAPQPSDAQQKAAEDALRKFVLSNQELIDLLGDPKDYFTGAHYEPKLNFWGVFFAHGSDTVVLIVEFESGQPFLFEHPVLKGILFPDVLPYADGKKAQESQVIALAFKQPDVAAAVRNQPGWTASSTLNTDGLWAVTFSKSGKVLVTATVDLTAQKVVKVDKP